MQKTIKILNLTIWIWIWIENLRINEFELFDLESKGFLTLMFFVQTLLIGTKIW